MYFPSDAGRAAASQIWFHVDAGTSRQHVVGRPKLRGQYVRMASSVDIDA